MRILQATVGPLAAASATAVSLAQTIPGAFNLVLDGASSTGYVANNIALAQSRGSAGLLTLNGSTVQSGVAFFQAFPGARVVIGSAANDTGITFTVQGIGADGRSGELEVVTGSNASRVSTTRVFTQVTSVTTSGATAGNVTVGTNALVATLDKPRRVIITSAGNDSGITFTVTGTDWTGTTVSNTFAGGNIAAAQSLYDFKTITGISASGATAGSVTVGTNGVASSPPLFLDEYAFAPTMLQVSASGTVNYTVRQSLEDPNAAAGYVGMNWLNSADAALVAATTTIQSSYTQTPKVTQVTLNSGTGSITYSVAQAGVVPQ